MSASRRAALLAAIAIFAVALWWTRRNHAPPLDSPAVLAQVQRLNRLTTVKYTVQKVVGLKEKKQPVGEESILLVMQATVEAGIDLSAMRAEDVSVEPGGTVLLKLPGAKILNVFVDEKETKVWDRAKTWWTPWVPYNLNLEQQARIAGLEAVRKAALEMGILKQAEENAEASIRAFLGLAGVKSVRIVPGSVS